MLLLGELFFFFLMIRRPPRSTRTDTLFPYTTLFRSVLHNELIRGGYAWVGISAQKMGVDGGVPPASPLPIAIPLKLINPLRYASLVPPGDRFSYDIYAQAPQAVRHPQDVEPPGALQVRRVIAAGETQSATRMLKT